MIHDVERDYCINVFSRNTLLDKDVRRKHKLFSQTEEFELEKRVIKVAKNEFLYINKFLQYRPVEEVLNMYVHGTMPLKEIMSKKMFAMVFVSNSTNNINFNNELSINVINELRKETGVFSLDDVDFRLIIDKENLDGFIMYDKMAHLYARFKTLRSEEVVCNISDTCTVEVSRNGQLFISF